MLTPLIFDVKSMTLITAHSPSGLFLYTPKICVISAIQPSNCVSLVWLGAVLIPAKQVDGIGLLGSASAICVCNVICLLS